MLIGVIYLGRPGNREGVVLNFGQTRTRGGGWFGKKGRLKKIVVFPNF